MVDVPELVRNKALAAGAEWWIGALADLISDLEDEWDITVGSSYHGGTEAFVADATCNDGTPAVLKLAIPRAGIDPQHEATVLRRSAGRGCAELYRHDAARAALLMERLGPSLFDLGLPLAERSEILCDAATRVWQPAPDAGLPTGAEKGEWLADYVQRLWEEVGRPCAARTVTHALECAENRVRAHDDSRAVLVHGDVQQWNALRADTGFKLVDPDGLLAEPEYDLGIIMREDPLDLLRRGRAQRRARWLADRTGLDEVAIWEWGVVERVSTGLVATRIGLQPVGRQMLEVADRLAG